MFGVPFILQVPREGMDHDQLYRIIVARMKRYLKVSDEHDLAVQLSTDAVADISSNNQTSCESEMDTEDAEMSLENGNELPSMDINGIDPVANGSESKRLFSMDLVNLGGNSSLGKIKQNGKPITLAGNVAIPS